MDFKQMFIENFGEENYLLLEKSFEDLSYRGLRINYNKMIDPSFFATLEKHNFVKDAYIYKKENQDYGKIPYHAQGCYYIQEPSAMLVGELLNIKENDLVIDLCAAPGGKSTHVARYLNEDGLLISNDINYKRALDLSENIERMGITNCIVINSDVKKISETMQGCFDKVILDAPCSGEGMFRKNSFAKDDWSMEKVNTCVNIQKEIILDAYKLLKYDGEMIYSTCTFNKYENEEMIKFLLENSNAELIMLPEIEGVDRGIDMKEAIRLFPYHYKGEGHFICKIRCKDEHRFYNKKEKTQLIKDKDLIPFTEFEKKSLNIKFDRKRLFLNGEHLYYLPKNALGMGNLRILRNGLYLGEIKSKHFVPSHSLALASKVDSWKLSIDLDDNLIYKYLKGESFDIVASNGFTLVTYKNNSIGFCKIANNTLKNHYPKGLRK